MSSKKIQCAEDTSTEVKIKNAARVIFQKKGFAAARTREITEEANINHALLNYYFRSKENLFNIIMTETLEGFFKSLTEVFTDPATSLDTKIDILVSRYIDFFIANPDIPLFVMTELKEHPNALPDKLPVRKIVMNTTFFYQFQQAVKEGKMASVNFMHFMMNLMSLIIFPFITRQIVKQNEEVSQDQFNILMKERKLLIPKWIKAMFSQSN